MSLWHITKVAIRLLLLPPRDNNYFLPLELEFGLVLINASDEQWYASLDLGLQRPSLPLLLLLLLSTDVHTKGLAREIMGNQWR